MRTSVSILIAFYLWNILSQATLKHYGMYTGRSCPVFGTGVIYQIGTTSWEARTFLTPDNACDVHNKPPEILEIPQSQDFLRKNGGADREEQSTIVNTPNGALEGFRMKAMNGRSFTAFEGIQYGYAQRWKLPTPARPWGGVKRAIKPGPFCLQLNIVRLLRVVGSENCLYLNVYTPELPPKNPSVNFTKYPVVVYIHGGAFILSSGSDYGPTYMLSEDVILITINYRLGVLGFMSTGDENLSGNYGLKDQLLALKWVHENIEYFGGNPQNVSIWGQSAGGVSVSLHMISQQSRKYFSTAVAISGTSFQHWSVLSRKKSRELADSLAKRLGCFRKDSRALVKCMQAVNADMLVAAQIWLYEWFPFPPVTMAPTVEFDHPDAFLTVTPEEAYLAGNVSKKPCIMGMTKDEGKGMMIILIPLLRMYPLRRMWSQIAPTFLELKDSAPTDATRNQLIHKIEQYYFEGLIVNRVSLNVLSSMVSDRYLNFGIVKGVQAHTSLGAPTYMYLFTYSEGKHNLANVIGYSSREWGVGHTEDVMYLFNSSILGDGHKQSDPDHLLSSIMINLLVNFAKTGKPLFKTTNGEHLEIWQRNDNPAQIQALQFDKNIKMIPFPVKMKERLKFWDNLNVPNIKLWTSLR